MHTQGAVAKCVNVSPAQWQSGHDRLDIRWIPGERWSKLFKKPPRAAERCTTNGWPPNRCLMPLVGSVQHSPGMESSLWILTFNV